MLAPPVHRNNQFATPCNLGISGNLTQLVQAFTSRHYNLTGYEPCCLTALDSDTPSTTFYHLLPPSTTFHHILSPSTTFFDQTSDHNKLLDTACATGPAQKSGERIWYPPVTSPCA
ncbi:hypothetical protein C365_01031 [Cryptococcus neoformans Bt85]|nr:hypothetical protein C365_01031 [Cryptococcus neoformans var. grubii Bt85]